jgi:hypothetical protein
MLLVASSPAFALQDSPLSFGPKIGVSFTNFRAPDDEEFKAGFCGGAFLAYAIHDWFTVQPELLYSMKGYDRSFSIFLSEDHGVNLDYIEIPVLAMLTIPTNSIFTPNIFVGPTMAFNVRAETYRGDQSEDIKDIVNVFEASMVFGGGLNVVLGPRGRVFTFDIRYVMGLTDIFDVPEGADEIIRLGNVFPGGAKNSVVSIMFGYGF